MRTTGRLAWQTARVTSAVSETPSVRTIGLAVPEWAGHRAGQHLDIRLTAEDGYSAERSYSIASAPGEPLAITVERLAGGEVSPYLTDELRPKDEMEIRGPIGGYFVWDPAADPRPVLLVAGGSGVVPFRSMLRVHDRAGSTVPVRLLYSARSEPDLIYRRELDGYAGTVEVTYTLTRQRPDGWPGRVGRVDAGMIAQVGWPTSDDPVAYVCGPTAFVEFVATALVGIGYPPGKVRTERFGGMGER